MRTISFRDALREALNEEMERDDEVFVIGEDVIAHGGPYAVTQGINERGSFRGVQVRRGTELVAEIDVYDYLLRGIVDNGVGLQPGDIIFVPVHGPRVKIVGEVTRPAVYELRAGETLETLIEIAGGLTPYATTEIATIDFLVWSAEVPWITRLNALWVQS